MTDFMRQLMGRQGPNKTVLNPAEMAVVNPPVIKVEPATILFTTGHRPDVLNDFTEAEINNWAQDPLYVILADTPSDRPAESFDQPDLTEEFQ